MDCIFIGDFKVSDFYLVIYINFNIIVSCWFKYSVLYIRIDIKIK